jgi:WD40 repeat protein
VHTARTPTQVLAVGASVIAALVLLLIGCLPGLQPCLELTHDGWGAYDLHFAPDGKRLAVVFDIGDRGKQVTRIYEIPDGTVVRDIGNAYFQCAWSPDGSLLAVLHGNGIDFDIWDTRTWDRKQQLHLSILDNLIRSGVITRDDQNMLWIQRLWFDERGDLCVVEQNVGGEIDAAHEVPRPHVWWNIDGRLVDGGSFGTTTSKGTDDASAASNGGETRLAVNYGGGIQILGVRPGTGGTPTMQLKYHLAGGGEICLTPDGQYLAMLGREFQLYRLFDDRAELIYWRPVRPKYRMDVSRDGRLVAYTSKGHVDVMRIPDCRTVLTIAQDAGPVALSPDGKLLAIVDAEHRESIRFYLVPNH